MDEVGTALLRRADDAYAEAVRDPGSSSADDLAGLVADCRRAAAYEALVVALRARAWVARHRLAAEEARADLDEAVRVAGRHRLSGRLVEVLATRAAVQGELGRTGLARKDLERARRIGGPASADLELQQAVLHHNGGRLRPAADLYAGLLAAPATPPAIRVKAANNLALIESHQGRHESALARLDAAREDARAVGPALVAILEDSRGWVTVQSGRLSEGLRILAAAADRHREAGLSLGEHYLEQCDAMVDLRLLPEASRMAAAALEEFSAHGVGLLAAEAQVRVARLAALAGDPGSAAAAARSAADLLRRQRRPAWAAYARVLQLQATTADVRQLRRCARVLEDAGMVSWATDAYLAAGAGTTTGRAPSPAALASLSDAERLCRGGPALLRLKGHVAGARRAAATGRRRALLAHARAGLTDLAEHRAALASTELRALASGHGVELGRLALRALLRDGSPSQVLLGMERTRAAALLVSEAPRVEGVDPLLSELRSVHEELAATRSAGQTEPPDLAERQRTLEDRIRRAGWTSSVAGVGERAPVPVPELRRMLDGRPLVEYAAVDGELVAVVLERRRSRLVHLGPLARVDAHGDLLMFALRHLARGSASTAVAHAMRDSARVELAALRDLLLGPLGLAPGEPLVVVPSALTWRLPWAHLCAAPVSLAPSAASWARTVLRAPPHAGGVVLVAGPGLDWAGTEVSTLAGAYVGAQVLVPPRSTVDAVVTGLRGARLAHLACHSRLRADNPTFSSFVLSAGELTVHELDTKDVAPHRVVLSACDSGADATYDGNEFVGFVSALLGRGTAGLLASCVQLSDVEAVPFMCRVHERLAAGDTLADALHSAGEGEDPHRPEGLAVLCAFSAYGAA